MTAGTVVDALPLFWPVVGFACLLAAVSAPVLGRVLPAPAWVVFGILASLGLIGAATLTPTSQALSDPWLSSNGCQVGSLHLPSLADLTQINETSLNVALFVPLGLACGLLRKPGQLAGAAVAAAALPIGVEFIQDSLPALGRVCTTDDVIANLLGLVLGLFAGGLAGLVAGPVERQEALSAERGQPDRG